MRFQKRILINYMALLGVSVAALCLLFYYMTQRRYESEEFGRLQTISGQMAQQLELRYHLVKDQMGKTASDGEIFAEVWGKEDMVRQIFHAYDANIRVTAVSGDGRILYQSQNGKAADLDTARKLAGQTGIFQRKNQDTGKREIVSAIYSGMTGATILIAEYKGVIWQKMSGFFWLMCSVLFVLVCLSVFFVYRASKRMARPVDQLRQQIENISFDNVEDAIQIEDSIDEIKALANANAQVIRRLKESLLKEKNLSYLQLQAQYDLLQAQINPHFFYNVLNLISARGLSMGDEEICEICESLSAMFRYATGNRTRYATVEEEMDYLEKYFYLMKLRYRHRLEYDVEADDRIKNEAVPKIVFQQIVENSIKHGFNSGRDVLRISVKGTLHEADRQWEMRFEDNGGGISEDTVREIRERMEQMRESLKSQNSNPEMEFGGMGLLNTYARLVLFFGDEAKLSIWGSPEGTVVTIMVPKRPAETSVSREC